MDNRRKHPIVRRPSPIVQKSCNIYPMPYILEDMVMEDIREVAAIEHLCFSLPWPTSAYRRELKTPETNRYIVVRFVPPEVAIQLGLQEPTVGNITSLEHQELE